MEEQEGQEVKAAAALATVDKAMDGSPWVNKRHRVNDDLACERCNTALRVYATDSKMKIMMGVVTAHICFDCVRDLDLDPAARRLMQRLSVAHMKTQACIRAGDAIAAQHAGEAYFIISEEVLQWTMAWLTARITREEV